MNPFDLRGPEFLGFYLLLIGALTLAAWVVKRSIEWRDVPPELGDADPYLIAHLRGGTPEAIRVAVIALIDRGLLAVEGDEVRTVRDAPQQARRPLERAILEAAPAPISGASIVSNDAVRAEAERLEASLRQLGLLPGPGAIAARLLIALTAIGALWTAAGYKISLALERGHHNVGLLVGLAALSLVPIVLATASRRTATGDRALSDLQTLFEDLKTRPLAPGAATNELALLAGIFGLSALGGSAYSNANLLFPAATAANAAGASSWGGDSSCSSSSCSTSSCSSSSCSSSSCGSSCGGCSS